MGTTVNLLKRFTAPYYVTNLMGLAVYTLLRQRTSWMEPVGYIKRPEQLWYWEKRALWLLLTLAAVRFLYRSTIDAFVADLLGYLKMTAMVLLCALDPWLGSCLIVWYLLTFLMFHQPRYEGPQHVDVLTPASFESQVLSTTTSAPFWFVMFTAPWSASSTQAQATFANLSLEYASEKLHFAELDVGRWPKVARRFQVSLDAIPHQLPAFLLFKHGKLVKRIPKSDDTWERKGKLRDRLLSEFDLDMVLAAGLKA